MYVIASNEIEIAWFFERGSEAMDLSSTHKLVIEVYFNRTIDHEMSAKYRLKVGL